MITSDSSNPQGKICLDMSLVEFSLVIRFAKFSYVWGQPLAMVQYLPHLLSKSCESISTNERSMCCSVQGVLFLYFYSIIPVNGVENSVLNTDSFCNQFIKTYPYSPTKIDNSKDGPLMALLESSL